MKERGKLQEAEFSQLKGGASHNGGKSGGWGKGKRGGVGDNQVLVKRGTSRTVVVKHSVPN